MSSLINNRHSKKDNKQLEIVLTGSQSTQSPVFALSFTTAFFFSAPFRSSSRCTSTLTGFSS